MLHKTYFFCCLFFLTILANLSIGQKVVSEKTEPIYGDGTKITRVTADELGAETTTIEEYDKNKNLTKKTVERKAIDGDKIIKVKTDTTYYKTFVETTGITIFDQNNVMLTTEWVEYDKEGYPTGKTKAERIENGDYDFFKMDMKTDTWQLERTVKKAEIDAFLPKPTPATDYNLPFPETTPPQPTTPGPISFGVKAGVNLASLSSDQNDNTKNIFSFHGGAFANINVSGPLRFQPELLYSIQGCNSEVQTGNTKSTDELRLHYILLPLMMQWYMANGLFFEAGPQAAYLIKAQYKFDGNEYDLLEQEIMNRFNFGVNAGAGYMFSKIALGVYIRYHLGLSNIWEDDSEKATNRLLMIGLMYNFGRK